MNGFSGRWRACVVTGAFAATGLSTSALADPAPPFAQLFRQTSGSPRIAVLEAEVARAEGIAEQAGTRPNPTISLSSENFIGSAPYGGFSRAETTLQVNQPIELGGKRSARVAAGRATVVASRARAIEGRLTYAYDLARAYGLAEIADRRIALAEDEVEEAAANVKLARALVVAGKEARLRQVQAETDLNVVEADLAGAEANRTVALARLSALAGVDVAFTSLSESLLDQPGTGPTYGPLDPSQGAAIRAAAAEREAAALRITIERKRRTPDVTVHAGIRRLEGERANALVAGVSLPLAIFDRNRGNIAAAEADLRGSEARLATVRLETLASSRSALAMLKASEARVVAALRTMATANESYRLARIAYQAGKSPLSELLAARHILGTARGVNLDAVAARFDARLILARQSGFTITGEPVQ